jgi:hypothetical protein
MKLVYETLRASPQWNSTLLIITYDEHGGFYDHVPTPIHGVPNPDGAPAPRAKAPPLAPAHSLFLVRMYVHTRTRAFSVCLFLFVRV